MPHDGGFDFDLTHEEPQRLSALYQYHNAPEVAPAHGLEYDDSNYPHSDKYPVIHSLEPSVTSKWNNKGFTDDNRPPRIIFGMKVKTFLVVAAVMILVIVGAAVGGAVGGTTIKNTNNPYPTAVVSNNTSTTSVPTATPSHFAAPMPTFTPLSDCPAANNTIYTSTFSTGSAGTVQTGSRLNFTRYCNVGSPLNSSTTLLSTFTYSLEDCIESCASLNFYNNNDNCKLAVFQANGTRPLNCWLGSYNTTYSSLDIESGMDVALLRT